MSVEAARPPRHVPTTMVLRVSARLTPGRGEYSATCEWNAFTRDQIINHGTRECTSHVCHLYSHHRAVRYKASHPPGRYVHFYSFRLVPLPRIQPFTPGMNVAAGPELAAAVTNAGGLGVIGGLGHTPDVLREQVRSPSLLLTGVTMDSRVLNRIANLICRSKR